MSHVNLHYIRAAIEANTGVTGLSLEKVRDLLVEEGLISQIQADKYATIFEGYAGYFGEIEKIAQEAPDECLLCDGDCDGFCDPREGEPCG